MKILLLFFVFINSAIFAQIKIDSKITIKRDFLSGSYINESTIEEINTWICGDDFIIQCESVYCQTFEVLETVDEYMERPEFKTLGYNDIKNVCYYVREKEFGEYFYILMAISESLLVKVPAEVHDRHLILEYRFMY